MPILPHLSSNIERSRNTTSHKIDKNTFYQPVVVYIREMKKGVFAKKEMIFVPFVAPYIFFDKEAAGFYLPSFISLLIKENSLPKNALMRDGSANEEIIKTYVKSVSFAKIEQEKEYKEGRLDNSWKKEEE